jgi:hypothetical protein
MKKLLMIGSILILGMTAFAGVEADLSNGGSGTTYNGKARMSIGSRGIATDGTTNGTLIVTPTINGGGDGTSLEFNFGDLKRDDVRKVMGRFKAEVVNHEGKLATLTMNNVDVTLEQVTMQTDGGSKITNLAAPIDLNNAAGNKLGTLFYEITNTKLNNSDKTYEADIVSTVEISGDRKNPQSPVYYTGTFDNNTVRAKIAVKNLDLSDDTTIWN